MKHLLPVVIALTLFASLSASAQEGIKYTEAADLTLVGNLFPDTPNPYHRLDTAKYKGFEKKDLTVIVQSSGLSVAFKTDSKSITILTEYGYRRFGNFSPGVALRGYDLYIKQDGKWLWASSGTPDDKHPDTPLKDVWMFFDELPLVKDWELFALRVYKSYCRHIFICGSNAHTLSKEMKSELRGWPLEFETWPLSFREFCDFKGFDRSSALESEQAKLRVGFDEFNRLGGMPAVTLTESVSLKYKRLQGYFDTMILKDFIEHFNVKNPLILRFFLKRAMAGISNPLSVNAIYGDIHAQGLKIAKDELYGWLEDACDIYLFLKVPKYSRSIAKQAAAQAKYYVVDNPEGAEVFAFDCQAGGGSGQVLCRR